MKLTTNWVPRRSILRAGGAVAGLVLAATFTLTSALGEPLSDSVQLQIQALHAEKDARTPAQQKIDSHLIYDLKQSLNLVAAPGVPKLRTSVRRTADGRAWVDLKATISPELLGFIRANNGTVRNSFPQYSAARILIPLSFAETLAARSDVHFLRSAVRALTVTGSVDSEGDTTHSAITARPAFGTTGAGVKVGVLSDSVDFLSQAQATGDLPAVIVLTGQSGVPATGEGTAMLEIVHDLAPDAELYFATAMESEASFAANILNLRAAGCDIIIDDVIYPDESPFQDGIVAQAVNSVTEDGALYFSAALNYGSKKKGTSGTWEGDFADGGVVAAPVDGKGGRYHLFGTNTYNTVTAQGNSVVLSWSDPYGASANDYDLYVVDSTGRNLISSSTTVQNGSQDPFEICDTPTNGSRIVVVRASGAARFLHLDTLGGGLELNTSGETFGHSCATNAFSVAAVDVHTAYPNPFIGGASEPVENFSSDGPRRVFYQADGTPITFGNYTNSGGALRAKPDITAADGVSTTLPALSGLNPFFGTSAAAPHAGAIAALVKSYAPGVTPAQMRAILTTTALDIEGAGYDYNSGFGIVMADRALNAAPKPAPLPLLMVVSNTIYGGNGNGIIDYNECNSMDVILANIGKAGASGVQVNIVSATPGAVVSQPYSPYLDLATNALGTNLVSFKISTAPDFACGTTITLNVFIKCDQNSATNQIILKSGVPALPIRFDSYVATPIPDQSQVASGIRVSNLDFAVSKMTVSLYTTHPHDRDLVFQLVSPDGTTNLLSANQGGSGQNYGLACSPDSLRTTFDDDAINSIITGAASFAGSYRPQEPLATFAGKSGSSINGLWQLIVSDTAALNVGTLQCWSLSFTRSVCISGGGECPGADMAIGMKATPDPVIVGNYLVYTISVTNRGPSLVNAASVSQALPDAFYAQFISAICSQGSASLNQGILTANLGTMRGGSTATITTTLFVVNTNSALTSTATVNSELPDFDPSNNSVTVVSRANPPTADLAVGFSALPISVLVGGTVTYTVSVTNNGPSAASVVTVTNVFPPGLLLQTSEATITQGGIDYFGNTVVCRFNILGNGAQASATIPAIAVTNGTMLATAVVTCKEFDPVRANNSASIAISASPAADLAVGIAAAPNPAVLSSNVTIVTTVTNLGPSTATGIAVLESLPVGVSVLSVTLSQGSYTRTGTNLSCSMGSLNPGVRATITVVVTTTKLGYLTTSCLVSANENDANLANNNASATILVGLPFVSITPAGASLTAESFSPPDGSLEPGETVTVQLRLQNVGNVVNTNLVATLLATNGVTSPSGSRTYGMLKPVGLPGGVPVSQPFTFTASGTNGGNVVATLQLLDGTNPLPAVSFTFVLPALRSYSNTSLIQIPSWGIADPYPSTILVSGWSNQVGKVTATLAGLTHTYPHDLDVLLVGPTGARTLLLSHAGGGAMAEDVTFTIDDAAATPIGGLDGIITTGSWQPSVYAPSPVFSNPAPAGPYSATLSTFSGLNPNGPWSLYVLDDSAGDVGAISNGWSLSFTGITPVNQVVDLGLSVATTNLAYPGDTITYVFTVTNAGPAVANVVTFSNALPASVVLASASSSQGNITTNGNLVVGNLASLNPGSTATVTVTVIVARSLAAVGLLSNTASVAGKETDLHLIDSTVTASTIVWPPNADLACGLSVSTNTVVEYSNLVYSITVTNNGPGDAFNVVVNDTLPTNMTYLSAAPSQGSVSVTTNTGIITITNTIIITNAGSFTTNTTITTTSTNAIAITANLGLLATGACANVTLVTAAPGSTSHVTNTVTNIVTSSSSTNVTVVTTNVSSIVTNAYNVVSVSTGSSDPVLTNNAVSANVTVNPAAPNIAVAGIVFNSEGKLRNCATDPNETVTISLILTNSGTLDTSNLFVTLLVTNGVSSAANPAVSYGRVVHGGSTKSGYFTFTVTNLAGATNVATWQLDDGGREWTLSYAFPVPLPLSNTNGIIIPEHGAASPYPSIINVSGLSGYVKSASVTISGLTHSFPSDLSVLLAKQGGPQSLLMSHVGGGYGVTNLTLTFDDTATTLLPQNARMQDGASRLTQYGASVNMPAPAPPRPYSTNLAAFVGVDPNGAWQLYVFDETRGNAGSIAYGWALNLTNITPGGQAADLVIGLAGSPGAVDFGGIVTYTMSVTNLGPDAAPSVMVTNILPDGFIVLAPPSGVSVAGSVVTWSAGRVESGAVTNVMLNTKAAPPAALLPPQTAIYSYSITASVSGDFFDPIAGNNSAQVWTTVRRGAVLSAMSTNGLIQLTIQASPGQTYDLRAATDLIDISSWASLGLYTVPVKGIFSVTDTNSPGYWDRYYRTLWQAP
jgi:uncharacterized repeat protein (TIGR01451 family)